MMLYIGSSLNGLAIIIFNTLILEGYVKNQDSLNIKENGGQSC